MADSKSLNKFTEDVSYMKQRDTKNKLKVGIIGTGWIAEYHLIAYKNMPRESEDGLLCNKWSVSYMAQLLEL